VASLNLEAPGGAIGTFADDGRKRSTLRQRRILTRIDRVREVLLFRPGPELADVLVSLYDLVPELETILAF
jgi:hypothetical protein